MIEWIRANDGLLYGLAGLSVVTFVMTLVAVPMVAVRIPRDYFLRDQRRPVPWAHHHPALRVFLLGLKNLLGYVFLLGGLAMLVLPGQGLLTILAAVVLLDFPGKFRLERWVATRRPVARSINWLRARAGTRPLRFEPDVEPDAELA